MTHYRLTLTKGRRPAIFELIAQSHQDTPRLVRGWATIMRADKSVSAHIRVCLWAEDQCPSYGTLRRHPTVPSVPEDESVSSQSPIPLTTGAQIVSLLDDGRTAGLEKDPAEEP